MAIKSLQTLIKLHKRRVDIIRREMIVMEEEHKQLLLVAEKLHKEHTRERELATAEPKIAAFFGAYSLRIKKRLEDIAKEVARLEAAIAEKAEAIRTEFSEQKKYEIARDHAQKRLDAAARVRQQQRFDEIGTQQYLQLKDNPV